MRRFDATLCFERLKIALAFALSVAGPWSFSTLAADAFTNTLGMQFVRVPAGTFALSTADDVNVPDSTESHRNVTLSTPFYILKGRVSDEWLKQAGMNGSANDVSWQEAAAFCAWLSHREGRTYRLPTEAEWVRALQISTGA